VFVRAATAPRGRRLDERTGRRRPRFRGRLLVHEFQKRYRELFQKLGPNGLEEREAEGARADRPARVPPHVRVADDRRGREREGALDVHRHASITITLDRYGHLFPGNEEEAAGLLDAFLERADTAARPAQVDG
jgi:hypothetical protein